MTRRTRYRSALRMRCRPARRCAVSGNAGMRESSAAMTGSVMAARRVGGCIAVAAGEQRLALAYLRFDTHAAPRQQRAVLGVMWVPGGGRFLALTARVSDGGNK